MLPATSANHVCERAVAATGCVGLETAPSCSGEPTDSFWGAHAWTLGGAYVGVGGAKHCGTGTNETTSMYTEAHLREHNARAESIDASTTDGDATTSSCTSTWYARVGTTESQDSMACPVQPVYPTDLILP